MAGILTSDQALELGPPLAAMQAALRHRGPDGEGCVQEVLPGGRRLGLVHTRLAILDVTDAGRQPMFEPQSGSWIAYNGEIYNHFELRKQMASETFHSRSDTETLLRAWVERGEGALPLLRGMFAFALYDGRRDQFWLVRDRLGVKPLYVCEAQPGTWLFASEVRALLATGLVERRLDRRALRSYLGTGAVPAPWTLIEGATSLLPGEAWCFPAGHSSTPLKKIYWRPPFLHGEGPAPTWDEATERLRPLLREACRLRMLADVPVGVFLSGGIDSSAIVASLAASGHRPLAFSARFDESRFDETEHARAVARAFGAPHHELVLSPGRVIANLSGALAAYDQPSVDGVNTYFISQAARNAGVKVALSGIGGDELFAGYPHFRWSALLEKWWARPPARSISWLTKFARPGSVRAWKLQAMLQAGDDRLQRHLASRRVLSDDVLASLLPDERDGQLLPEEVLRELEQGVKNLDAVNDYSRMDLATYLANTLLRDTDQMSMAHGLEVREPWLDHALVEEVARLPGALKLRAGRQSRLKGLFVDSLPLPLPPTTLGRRKMGFVLPWEHWLRGELSSWCASVLTDAAALQRVGLEPRTATRVWTAFQRRQPGVRASDVLALLHLAIWGERLTANDPVHAPQSCQVA